MRVNGIFHSVQGEGVLAGVPMVFIRLQGCNLRCEWCDTPYALDPLGGQEMTPAEVTQEVFRLYEGYQKRWICVTGGEPLFQSEELRELLGALRRHGSYLVEVETNGSFPPPSWFSAVDSWVADIKCPSSGVCGASRIDKWFRMRRRDQVKFVVANREDLGFVRQVLGDKLCIPTVLVSPMIPNFSYEKFRADSFRAGESTVLPDEEIIPIIRSGLWLQEVAEFCKEVNARFSLQIHKVVWGNQRGV